MQLCLPPFNPSADYTSLTEQVVGGVSLRRGDPVPDSAGPWLKKKLYFLRRIAPAQTPPVVSKLEQVASTLESIASAISAAFQPPPPPTQQQRPQQNRQKRNRRR